MTETRILVTGSQGFVGRHLRRALSARRCTVIGVDRPGTGSEVELDLATPELDMSSLAARLGPVSGIIYMAATITRGSSVDGPARSNLRAIADAPVRMLEAWHALHGPTHVVYCSTYKGYGPPERLPIDPQRPPQRPDPHSYGSAKALAERLLDIAARRTGARYAVVRPTCIYGPGQHLHNAIPVFLRSCWQGQNPVIFGSGSELRDDVFAPDLAFCLAEACLQRAEGPFHAAGERGRTIIEVAELCCRAVAELGGPSGIRPVLDASRPPKWWIDQSFDLQRTRNALGYEPTPLLEGLKHEARWIKAQGSAEAFAPEPRVRTRAAS
ncbi:MAG TPA: NAD(P)-dependent oxidoreductase [Polyangiaceae bacterium]